VPKDTHGNAAIHYTTVYKVGSSSNGMKLRCKFRVTKDFM
jgi:hypothetical protein